jgi:hypothetical protein
MRDFNTCKAVSSPLLSLRSKKKVFCLASGSSAKEVGRPGEFEALTDDELERALRERFSASGLTPDAGTRH